MACRTMIRAAAAVLAAVPLLAACATSEPSTADTSDNLPTFRWAPPRMRAPSTERPPWLPSLPADLPRIAVPDHGFRG
jgi:hypothetical protein